MKKEVLKVYSFRLPLKLVKKLGKNKSKKLREILESV